MSNRLIVFLAGCALSLLVLLIHFGVKEDRKREAACEARGGVPVPVHYQTLCLSREALK